MEKIKENARAPRYYVYRFNDIDSNTIYLGKTTNIKNRMKQHFSESGHLPKQCYESVFSIDCAELGTRNEMNIYETYLIDTIRPKWNTVLIYDEGMVDFELPALKWERFMLNGKPNKKDRIGFMPDSEFKEMKNIRHMQNLLYKQDNEIIKTIYRIETFLLHLMKNLEGDDLSHIKEIKKELNYLRNYRDSNMELYSEVIKRT